MLNIDYHRRVSVNLLKEIYSDPVLRVALGFKGGTAAMLFYDLPRFSVDLDFDLLDSDKKEAVFLRLKEILTKFGNLVDAAEKKYTLFFLLVYQKGERNLKIEVSKRASRANYEVKNYLGVSMFVMKKEDAVAGKLAALLTRKRFAARDVFDMWFFLNAGWPINDEFLKEKTGMNLTVALDLAIKKIGLVKTKELLNGLGDLLDEKQRTWVRANLQTEVLFLLKLYQSELKRSLQG